MFHDERGVDRRADMVCQRWIGIGLFESVEFPVLDVAKPGRKAPADQAEQPKDMIAGTACICEQLLDLQDRVVVEQAIEDIDGLALGRTDRQNAEVAVLVGKPAIRTCYTRRDRQCVTCQRSENDVRTIDFGGKGGRGAARKTRFEYGLGDYGRPLYCQGIGTILGVPCHLHQCPDPACCLSPL